jgi:hypothetical protein
MRLKVMLSSVRRGLADVRDSVAPVLTILNYECLRFEQVSQQPVPPRAVCVQMVEESDMYLLLLGEFYGDPMPATGIAPTDEEWTAARNLGKPVVVFRQEGINPEPRQIAFIDRVASYEDGVWRGTFENIPDLIGKLPAALEMAATALQPLTLRPLDESIDVPWREADRGFYTGAGTVLETHIIPVGRVTPLPASSFSDLRRQLARAGQDHGLFDDGEALQFPTTERAVAAHAARDGRRLEAGVRIERSRNLSVWESLPQQIGGSLLDENQLRVRVARDLRLGAALNLVGAEDVAIGIGLDRPDSLVTPSGPGSVTFPFSGRSEAIHLDPTEAVPTRALAAGADDLAKELVARLLLRLRERS